MRSAEREAEERTKPSTHEQALGDCEERFQAANQELHALRYSVSHDLRAPLRHILGYVDILQARANGKLDETSRNHLQTIARAAEQMGKMMDALLELSRIGSAAMVFQRVSFAAVVEDVQRELSPDIKKREIDWQIADLPAVQGDPLMLRRVIFNLLSNAVKYTGTRRRAKIEIGSKQDQRETILFVRDNGVGFDPNCAEKLFGAFQRLHPPNDFEGTGVGLANVRRIVHKHGGRTWAEGKVANGATFYFSIPKRPEQATLSESNGPRGACES